MELSTVELELTTKTGAEKETLSGLKLMTLCTSGNVANLNEVFPNAEVIETAVALEGLRFRTNAARPDAVVFLADGISELFMQQIRYADKILKPLSIPLIVVCDNLDKDTKKIVLKNGADDCFSTTIHAEGFAYWIDFLKRFKKFQREKPAIEPEPYGYKISLAKRMFDIIVSSIALILAAPVMAMIAIAIRLESNGPVFYISKRAGSGYKIFNFLKFRSMRVGADAELAKLAHLNQYAADPAHAGSVFFKIQDDPRITKLGKFLRNTSLDELPQLINVLKGDMSIVGNRPLPLYEAQQLTKEQSAMRFMTAAGITGLWQVTKRGKKELSEAERIELDVQYAMHNSFQNDMKLIVKTLPALTQQVPV
ncbi:MAG TPA: sugar transferase [Cyclobacteriaceae bacterium]|nr:sugar transferase [Cyclobacteriaceae bacterium]